MPALSLAVNSSIKLEFTVSDVGTVKEAKILDSQGGSKFEKSSLAALEKWRYAPKFADGQAVATKKMKVQMDFKVRKSAQR